MTGQRRERVTRLRGTKVTEALREPALSPGEAAHGGYPRVFHASIMDARGADRCGLLADRMGDGLCERVLVPGPAQIERAREYGAQKGGMGIVGAV